MGPHHDTRWLHGAGLHNDNEAVNGERAKMGDDHHVSSNLFLLLPELHVYGLGDRLTASWGPGAYPYLYPYPNTSSSFPSHLFSFFLLLCVSSSVPPLSHPLIYFSISLSLSFSLSVSYLLIRFISYFLSVCLSPFSFHSPTPHIHTSVYFFFLKLIIVPFCFCVCPKRESVRGSPSTIRSPFSPSLSHTHTQIDVPHKLLRSPKEGMNI